MSLNINLYHWSTDEFSHSSNRLRNAAVGLSRTCICGCWRHQFYVGEFLGIILWRVPFAWLENHFENSWDTFLSCHVPRTFQHQSVSQIHGFLVVSRPIQPNPLRFLGWNIGPNGHQQWTDQKLGDLELIDRCVFGPWNDQLCTAVSSGFFPHES